MEKMGEGRAPSPAPAAADAGAGPSANPAAGTAAAGPAADLVKLQFKWNKLELEVHMEPEETVEGLKRKLAAQTNVPEKRQKLLGLKTAAGRPPLSDGTPIADLALKPGARIMLLGQADEAISELERQAEVAPHVQDDWDIGEEGAAELELRDRPEVQEKLRRRIESVSVKVLNPPRPGRKCLVLDIDYTLFDLNSTAERPEELARPYLHAFLASAYEHYDILIWSATSMRWVEVKMRELGCMDHPGFKLTCMLDHQAMVTVQHGKYGVFDLKPLQVIWAKFPEHYNEHNTIMFDDLRRNYLLNKQNGLVIRPFRKAHLTRATDRELLYLSAYLAKIAPLESLSGLNHKHWEAYARQEIRELRKKADALAAEPAPQQQAGRPAGGGGDSGRGAG